MNRLTMGRKRNQGKARKAAKEAKAREEEAEQRVNNNQAAETSEQSLSAQRQLQADEKIICRHGFDPYDDIPLDDISKQFIDAFSSSFRVAVESDRSIAQCLVKARDATLVKFADVWNDSTKLEIAISFYLAFGTQQVLDGDCDDAHLRAAYARYLEQHIAVELKRTQAL